MKFIKFVKPKTTWHNDNYLGWVAGGMFVLSVIFLWAGKMRLNVIKLPPEKCYTAAGCIWILVGTLWLACAVLLSRRAKSTLSTPLPEWREDFELAAVADLTNRASSAPAKREANAPIVETLWPVFGRWIAKLLGANAASSIYGSPSAGADRLEALELRMENLAATVKKLADEAQSRRELDKAFTNQAREKIEVLSEAVLGAAHNVFVGALYVIFGTVLLMAEIFWQNPWVRDVLCPEADWECRQQQASSTMADPAISFYFGSQAKNNAPANQVPTATTVPT